MAPYGLVYDSMEVTSRREIEALQLKRLRWQVNRCYRESPFYREKFRKTGVAPDDLKRLEDFARFPLVTKGELREEQASHPPFGRYALAPREEWAELHPSTGTTGVPVNTIWSRKDVENIAHFTARFLHGTGIGKGFVIQNAFSYGLWVAGLSVHYAAKEMGAFVIPTGAAPVERQIFYLREARPQALIATPSFGLYISSKLQEQKTPLESLNLRIGMFGGEAGTEVPSTRRRLEQGLGVDAHDFYGLAEISPTMAAECKEKDGLHWADDHFYVEVLNPETREPLGEGEEGVLTITHLTREATPMIRYWTNDLATLTKERCACGRTVSRSRGGILGRSDDMVVYRGAKFYPVQVERVVRSHPTLGDEFRIRLYSDEKGLDKLVVTVEHRGDMAKEEAVKIKGELESVLRAELAVRPEIEIVAEGSLERTTFKAKRLEDVRAKYAAALP